MAVGSDLAVVLRSQRADVAHLDHGRCKGREEGLLISSKSVDVRYSGGTRRGRQDLVGGEEPLGGSQVFVIFVVECVGRGHVEINESGRRRSGGRWPAERLQQLQVGGVHGGIGLTGAAKVVETRGNEGAPRPPNGVATRQGGDVELREAEGTKLGNDGS